GDEPARLVTRGGARPRLARTGVDPRRPRPSPSGPSVHRRNGAPEAAMAAHHPRRVNLIERQRDQSESEAVSDERAQQWAVPTYSSLPRLTRHTPASAIENH